MGYTHYFGGVQPNASLAADAQAIAEASGVSIKGWDGECEPRVLPDVIDFNGDASLNEDYETFRLIAGDYDFNFCKTGRRPYDKVVGAVLLRAIVTGAEGSELIGTDGRYEDWDQAGVFDLYRDVFGEISDADWEKVRAVLQW